MARAQREKGLTAFVANHMPRLLISTKFRDRSRKRQPPKSSIFRNLSPTNNLIHTSHLSKQERKGTVARMTGHPSVFTSQVCTVQNHYKRFVLSSGVPLTHLTIFFRVPPPLHDIPQGVPSQRHGLLCSSYFLHMWYISWVTLLTNGQ